MAPFEQKRRKSSETAASRSVRSRAALRVSSTQSNARSGSRYTTGSRKSSTQSSQAQTHPRAPQRRISVRSERPVSAATSRTFAGDDQSVATTEAPPPDDHEIDVDLQNEVIMAVNLTDRGTVGCAYYAARDEKLYFMEDAVMGGADIVDACGSSSLLFSLVLLTQAQ